MKKNYLFLAVFFALSGIFAQQTEPRSYVAHKITSPLKIDGKATEKAWENAPFTDFFVDIEGKKTPQYATRIKMLWSEEYWYIFAQMQEPHVWANLRQRDTVIFYNNDFEVFADPDGDTHNYYELEINALNTAWDLFLTKPYREGAPIIDGWDIQGLQSAVQVQGTLNNPADTDQGWTLEIAIPWKAFRTAYGQDNVPRNRFWRVNFSRVNWDFELHNGKYARKKDKNGKFLPEYNWVWSPQGVINMHEPERWGYVFFTEAPNGTPVSFRPEKDEHLKWYLYELYRKTKKLPHPTQIPAPLAQQMQAEKTFFGKRVRPELETHSQGWNLVILSPFSGKKLILRHDGAFSEKK